MPSKWKRDAMKKEYEDHKKRVRGARSLLDLAPPRPMPMSERRELERKRQQAHIEFDNRLLMDRLAVAMDTKNIDNVLVKKPFISMNELQRRKALMNLTRDNHRLLERIQNAVPSYDPVQWKIDEVHHLEVLRNMSELPQLFEPPGARKSLLNPWYNKNYGKDNFVEADSPIAAAATVTTSATNAAARKQSNRISAGSNSNSAHFQSGELHRGAHSSAFSQSGSIGSHGNRGNRVRSGATAVLQNSNSRSGSSSSIDFKPLQQGTHSMQSSPSNPHRMPTSNINSNGSNISNGLPSPAGFGSGDHGPKKAAVVAAVDEDYLQLLETFEAAVALK